MRQRRRLPGRTPPPRRAPNPRRAGLEPRASSSGWLVCGHVLTPPNPSGDENAAAVPPADAPPAVTPRRRRRPLPLDRNARPVAKPTLAPQDRCDDRPLSLGARSERSLGRVPAISFPELRPSTIGPRHLAVVAWRGRTRDRGGLCGAVAGRPCAVQRRGQRLSGHQSGHGGDLRRHRWAGDRKPTVRRGSSRCLTLDHPPDPPDDPKGTYVRSQLHRAEGQDPSGRLEPPAAPGTPLAQRWPRR
jgi:hypothetical protein